MSFDVLNGITPATVVKLFDSATTRTKPGRCG